MKALSAKDEQFVQEVAWRLQHPDERRAQDQLDVFLLGGTVPAEPVRYPDPDCRDCWGEGWVCSCHGFARSYSRTAGDCYLDRRGWERCPCWRRALSASQSPPASVHVGPEGAPPFVDSADNPSTHNQGGH